MVFWLLLGLSGNFLFAQTWNKLEDLMQMDLEDLLNVTVVSGARHEQKIIDSPRSISVITAEEIRRKNYRTTPEALNELVGVLVQETNYGGGSPIIRGLIGNQILILIDGIRLNNAIFRYGPNQYLNTIDINQIERIEVIRGTGSVLYGSDALGGLINIITKSRENFHQEMDISSRIFSRYASADDGKTGRVDFAGNVRSMGIVGGFSYKNFGDLRAGAGTGLQSFTGYGEWDADFKLNYRSSERQNLTLALQHIHLLNVSRTDKLLSGSDLKREWDPETRDLFYAQYELKEIHSLISSFHAGFSYQNQSEDLDRITSSTPNIQQEHQDEVKSIGFMFQFHSWLSQNQLFTYGAEYYLDDVKSRRVDVDLSLGTQTDKKGTFADQSTYKSIGIFLQNEIQLTEPMSVILGLRYSSFNTQATVDDPITGVIEVNSTPHALTGSAYFSYRVTNNFTFNLGLAQGFRAPNLDDLTILGSFGSGFEVPNPNLDPEQSINYEVGLKAQHEKFSGSLYYFLSNYTNLIERGAGTYNGLSFLDYNGNSIQDQGEDNVFQRQNVGEARIQGIETEGQILLLPVLTAYGNIAWIKGDDLINNEPLRRIPPIKGQLGVKWMLKRDIWMEYYNLLAAKQDRLAPGDIEDPRISDGGTPGFVTFNLRGGIDFNRWGNLTMALENITNKAYRLHSSGIDSPGRNLVIGYELYFRFL
jgi:TonB-dependent heme/hemoglobin receptor